MSVDTQLWCRRPADLPQIFNEAFLRDSKAVHTVGITTNISHGYAAFTVGGEQHFVFMADFAESNRPAAVFEAVFMAVTDNQGVPDDKYKRALEDLTNRGECILKIRGRELI